MEGEPVLRVGESSPLHVERSRRVHRGDEDRHGLEPRAVLAAGSQPDARHLAPDVACRERGGAAGRRGGWCWAGGWPIGGGGGRRDEGGAATDGGAGG